MCYVCLFVRSPWPMVSGCGRVSYKSKMSLLLSVCELAGIREGLIEAVVVLML